MEAGAPLSKAALQAFFEEKAEEAKRLGLYRHGSVKRTLARIDQEHAKDMARMYSDQGAMHRQVADIIGCSTGYVWTMVKRSRKRAGAEAAKSHEGKTLSTSETCWIDHSVRASLSKPKPRCCSLRVCWLICCPVFACFCRFTACA